MVLSGDLKNVASSQKNELENFDYGIPREQARENGKTPGFARILVGVRRCGKSTLMQQLRKKNGGGGYFNFEDPRIAGFQTGDFQKLLDAIQDAYGACETYYFDEIQVIEKWEWFVRQLLDANKRVVITGSNASLFGRETGTKLTGRHLDFEVFPFDYRESTRFFNQPPGSSSYRTYLEKGGFPEHLKTQRADVLQRLFDDILARDIIVRHNLKNTSQLRELAVSFITNIGKEFSFNSQKKALNFAAIQTVIDYTSYLQDSFLLFAVPKFDYSYKKRVAGPKKIYAVDTGLAKTLSATFTEDRGRLLENSVYLELRRRYGSDSVFFFKKDRECDFVIKEKNKVTQAIQVAYSLDRDNEKMETSGLEEAMRELGLKKGFIITMDQQDTLNLGGKTVDVQPAYQWSANKNLTHPASP